MKNQFQTLAIRSGGVLSALLILSIPFSTSIAIIISGLLLLSWFFSGQFFSLPKLLKKNKIVFTALLLSGFLLIRVTYSSASFEESIDIWFKYREFLLIVILIPFLSIKQFRQWAIASFILGSILNLVASYAIEFDLIKRTTYSVSLKSAITHSIFVAYFAYFCAQQAYRKTSFHLLWCILVVFSIHNLFFVTLGRSGQVIALLLALLFCLQHFSKKNMVFFITTSFFLMVLFVSSSYKGHRYVEAITNIKNYDINNPETTTSMGRRLTYWRHALTLIKERPWLGYGTGSFAREYSRISLPNEHQTSNPHNSYLLITAQLGVTGLLLYLGFLFSLFFYLPKLSEQQKWLAQGVLLTMITSSLFNSPILDHTEGHWFACLIAIFFQSPEKGSNLFDHFLEPTGFKNEIVVGKHKVQTSENLRIEFPSHIQST